MIHLQPHSDLKSRQELLKGSEGLSALAPKPLVVQCLATHPHSCTCNVNTQAADAALSAGALQAVHQPKDNHRYVEQKPLTVGRGAQLLCSTAMSAAV